MLREPPTSVEAERSAIAGATAFPQIYPELRAMLTEEMFAHHPGHWGSVCRLYDAGRRPMPAAIAVDTQDDCQWIYENISTPGVTMDMAKLVRDLWSRKQVVRAAEELIQAAIDRPVSDSLEKILADTEAALGALAWRGSGLRQLTAQEAFADALEVTSQAYQRDSGLVGISSGLRDLDNEIGGLVPTELLILAGRPGMGKTALATNIAVNVARAGTPVGFFTVEMSAQQIAMRILAERSHIPANRMRRGKISEDEFNIMLEEAEQLQDLPLRFDQTPSVSITALGSTARRWRRRHNIGLLVVDYLQLMKSSTTQGSRVQEITEITTGLKAIAKELEIPVLALSQLSRNVEGREDKRPMLSDLRESGSIEQDADVVMFVYRDAYYLERSRPKMSDAEAFAGWTEKHDKVKGKAEIIIAKQRHGPTGSIELAFRGDLTVFSDLAQEA